MTLEENVKRLYEIFVSELVTELGWADSERDILKTDDTLFFILKNIKQKVRKVVNNYVRYGTDAEALRSGNGEYWKRWESKLKEKAGKKWEDAKEKWESEKKNNPRKAGNDFINKDVFTQLLVENTISTAKTRIVHFDYTANFSTWFSKILCDFESLFNKKNPQEMVSSKPILPAPPEQPFHITGNARDVVNSLFSSCFQELKRESVLNMEEKNEGDVFAGISPYLEWLEKWIKYGIVNYHHFVKEMKDSYGNDVDIWESFQEKWKKEVKNRWKIGDTEIENIVTELQDRFINNLPEIRESINGWLIKTMKRIALELSGKQPTLVHPDEDDEGEVTIEGISPQKNNSSAMENENREAIEKALKQSRDLVENEIKKILGFFREGIGRNFQTEKRRVLKLYQCKKILLDSADYEKIANTMGKTVNSLYKFIHGRREILKTNENLKEKLINFYKEIMSDKDIPDEEKRDFRIRFQKFIYDVFKKE